VQVVEKGPPRRVVVEYHMREADDFIATFSDNGVLVQPGRSKAIRPDLKTVGDDIAVEVRIEVRTAIVATPAFSVKDGDVAGVLFGRVSILHDETGDATVVPGMRHCGPLIVPGVGTVPKPAAGPSQGQVPQVTLDEQRQDTCDSVVEAVDLMLALG